MADGSVPGPSTTGPEATLAGLRADCSRCAGLCCVATAFARSAEFAIDKPAGVPCPHLSTRQGDFGCTVHDELRPRGFVGCTTYDCFGAGQHVVQETYAGATWRDKPDLAGEMFRVFHVGRALHELLWLLDRAAALPEAAALRDQLAAAAVTVRRLAAAPAGTLDSLDVDDTRARVVPLLREASELARAGLDGPELSGADLVGHTFAARSSSGPSAAAPVAARHIGAGLSLRGASLRGALLVGADLRHVDLHRADVTGADLRSADVCGADLREVLFLSQQQVDTARGDGATLLPGHLVRPRHWPEGGRA